MLNTFVSNIAGRGLAPKNRYRMSIRPPSAIGKFSNDMALMCDTIEFPGQNMMSSPDMMRHGPPREAVTGVSYASITASFLCTPDMQIKRFFENWQLLVMDMNTWEPNYYKNYIGGSKIYQLDRANNTTYVVELFEVYPKTITAQDLGYAQADAFHTVSVELMFHHWEWSDELTLPAKTATSISVDNWEPVDDFGGMEQANQARLAQEKGVAEGVDDFSSMPDADKPSIVRSKYKFRWPQFGVNKGIISVPPGTKTTASWPKNPHR